MALPLIKSRVLSIRAKDQAIGQSVEKLDKSGLVIELYKLEGNKPLYKMQKYRTLMKKYINQFSGEEIVRSTRKEIKTRRALKGYLTPSPLSLNRSVKYQTSRTHVLSEYM